ncbi:hypothetical protein O3G_MSEX000050 [Manduca sexta]|nr:hypothetical protein O3G_MSEX000050 [Manduca sexta]
MTDSVEQAHAPCGTTTRTILQPCGSVDPSASVTFQLVISHFYGRFVLIRLHPAVNISYDCLPALPNSQSGLIFCTALCLSQMVIDICTFFKLVLRIYTH